MSRVGRKADRGPEGRQRHRQQGGTVAVKGPKGELKRALPDGVDVKVDGGEIARSTRADDSRENRAKHGLMRALLANMVKGVTDGFERKLEINGVGYRAEVDGPEAQHRARLLAPGGVRAAQGHRAPRSTRTSSSSPASTASCSARPRRRSASFRPPEPYKGKGIKYVEEVISARSARPAQHGRQGQYVEAMREKTMAMQDRSDAGSAASAHPQEASTAPPSGRAWRCSAREAHLRPGHRRRRAARRSPPRRRSTKAIKATLDGPKKSDAAKKVGAAIAKQLHGQGHRQGRLRPQRLHLPRARQRARRRAPAKPA